MGCPTVTFAVALSRLLRFDVHILALSDDFFQRHLFFGVLLMEYRNIEYSVFQDTGLGTWKWTVNVNESTVESGTSKTREAALSAVVLTIDRWKARAPKIQAKAVRGGDDNVSVV